MQVRVQESSSVQFIQMMDQKACKAGQMKVHAVLVYPEWLRVAEWV